jgi:uncharacterized RDD family membrane protein YckC
VLQACPKCGAPNDEQAQACSVCDAVLTDAAGEQMPVAVGVPSSEPEWRREVAHRLAAYRARRRRFAPDDSQTAMPFLGENGGSGKGAAARTPVRPLRPRSARSPRMNIEIAVVQRSLDFSAADESALLPHAGLFPVADLRERVHAGLLDAFFLLLAYAGFLALFGALGGRFGAEKSDLLVYGVTLLLFYIQYFGLFTALGGLTPGMRLRGLALVNFEGQRPSFGQLLWRSFGYLVSGGAVLLGFLWALWDEHHLTWQDRVSQTYITPVGFLDAAR